MAHITTNTQTSAPRFGLGGLFRSIGNALVMIAEANHRVRRADRLNAMSDAELSKLGIRREDIARHVFGDSYYL